MTSDKYNSSKILDFIYLPFREYPEYWLIQDNVPYYKSRQTKTELYLKGIKNIEWPLYPPDLNIIGYVWNYMKN